MFWKAISLQDASNHILVIPYETIGLVFASNFTLFVYLLDSFIRAVAFSYNSSILLNTIPLDEQADIEVEAVVPI